MGRQDISKGVKGKDFIPSVSIKSFGAEVLWWQELVVGVPVSIFSALWNRRWLLQGRKKICDMMCHPDGQQRQKERYLGLHVWEETL